MENTIEIINGKKIAEEFCEKIKSRVENLKEQGIFPCLALINASDDPASEIYVSKKEKQAASLGIKSETYKFQSDAKESDIVELIKRLNEDKSVHGILIQAPLAEGLNFKKLINKVSVDKDVDGLTLVNQRLLASEDQGTVPCTPCGVLHLIKTVRENTSGLHAVILGRSQIVGRPLASLLLNSDCSVTVLHSRSKNTSEICRTADILISAVGKPKFVGKEFVKPGAIVIDVGINRVINSDGTKKVIGDVDFDEVCEVAGAITPVPNGVGPMTVAYLMYNTIELAIKQNCVN